MLSGHCVLCCLLPGSVSRPSPPTFLACSVVVDTEPCRTIQVTCGLNSSRMQWEAPIGFKLVERKSVGISSPFPPCFSVAPLAAFLHIWLLPRDISSQLQHSSTLVTLPIVLSFHGVLWLACLSVPEHNSLYFF